MTPGSRASSPTVGWVEPTGLVVAEQGRGVRLPCVHARAPGVFCPHCSPVAADGLRVVFTIPGAVRVKKNSLRRIKRGDRVLTVSSAAHERWANGAQLRLQAARHRQPDVNGWGPLNLRALIYLDKEPGLTNLDNLIASVMDVLQEADVVKDDAQIRGLDGCRIRVDRAAPRVEITLAPLETP